MPATPPDLLSVFGECILLLDHSRRVKAVTGNTIPAFDRPAEKLLGTLWTDLIEALPDRGAALYWVIEAAFEHHVAPRFLPTQMPFKPGFIVSMAPTPDDCFALRFQPDPYIGIDQMIWNDLRPALTSTVGFANVILKGIDGPLTDIQIEDMNVIFNDAQFALNLVEAARNRWIAPLLAAPVPVSATDLLRITPEDIPQRRFSSLGLGVQINMPPAAIVYSNGAIRTALLELIRLMPQWAAKQSQIGVSAQTAGEALEVCLAYRAADNSMKAVRRIEPVDLFSLRRIKRSARITAIIAALHAQLSPYGCTAWALPTESMSLARIMMTVPLWNGPTERP